MAEFFSSVAPTPTYSDPSRALNIKALEARQKEMLANMANANAITPDNTQTPVQGFGHVINQIADQMNANRVAAQAAEGRQRLAALRAGIDLDKGPTSSQIGQAGLYSDDVAKELESQAFNMRQKALERQAAVDEQNRRYGFEGEQKGLDRAQQEKIQKGSQEFQHGENELTRKSAAEEAQKTRQQQFDVLDKEQQGRVALANAEREFKAAQAAADRLATSGDTNAKLKAQSDLMDKKAQYDAALQAQSDAAHLARTKLGVEAEQQKPLGEAAKNAADVKAGRVTQEQVDALNVKPTEVAKGAELQHQAAQRDALLNELEQARVAFDKGINIGPGAGIIGGMAQYSGGLLGDKEKAQRTELFDNTMNKVATMDMSTTLKGQSTDFEMRKFQAMYNNPMISMDAKREAFKRVLETAKKDAAISAAAAAKVGESGRVGVPADTAAPAAGDQDAAARAWLADPANANSPYRAGVERRLGGGK